MALARVPNLYIRYLLGQISKELGDFKDEHWQEALREFGYKCAYTGVEGTEAQPLQMDHVIPHNREHGGLHLPGNIVPCSPEANEAKLSMTLDEFFASSASCLQHLSLEEREEKKQSILAFQKKCGYDQIAKKVSDDILESLQSQYESIRQQAQESAQKIVAELKGVIDTEKQ